MSMKKGLGWILGLFTLPISKQMRSLSRTEQRYAALLMEINPVIERLDVEKSGLLLSSHLLNDLIAKSLILFRKFDPEHENSAYYPTQTSVMLIMIWGGTDTHNPDFDKIGKIQNYFKK
jgi:hypothetical protein